MLGSKKKEKQSLSELRRKEKLKKKAESEEISNSCDGDICEFQPVSQGFRDGYRSPQNSHNGSPIRPLSPPIQVATSYAVSEFQGPYIISEPNSQKDVFKEFLEKMKEDISREVRSSVKIDLEAIRNVIKEELEPIKREMDSLESSIKDLSLMYERKNDGKIDHFYFYFTDTDLIFKIRLPELKTMIYNQSNVVTEDTTIKAYYYHSTDKTVKDVNVKVIVTNKTITIDPIGTFPKLRSGYYTLFTK